MCYSRLAWTECVWSLNIGKAADIERAGGEQGDVSPKKETKKEPHDVWLFIQTNESAQGRPAGLVATLLAAVLPPWRPEVTTSLRTRGAYSTGSRGVGAGAAAGVAMGA